MLEDEIKKAVIADLKGDWTLFDWHVQHTPIILDAYHRGIVSDEDIESALHHRTVQSGRKAYTFCTKDSGQFQPDHFLSEELAYAIASGEIGPRAAERLKFCHGETVESFVKEFLPRGPKEYIRELREKLLGQDKTRYEDTWGMTAPDIDQYARTEEIMNDACDPHPACCH